MNRTSPSKPQITVVGSANVDFFTTVERLPRPGETVMGSDLQTTFGGKGANQAVAAARLGASVSFVGRVGDDGFGARYLEHLTREQVDVTHVAQERKAATGSALIPVAKDGDNLIVVCPGANGRVATKDIDKARATIEASKALLLQLEIPHETVKHAIQVAGGLGVPVILNPSPINGVLALCSPYVTHVIINEHEAQTIAGGNRTSRTTLECAASVLHDRGIQNVIITRGSEPTLVFAAGKCVRVPSISVTPVDTVGAGDTFAGAYGVAISEGLDPVQAAAVANCAGALSTLKPGAQTAMPTRRQVQKAMASKTV